MIGYYNYTVILTYIGLCSAVYGINMALDGHGSIRGSLICLMICGLCDMFDGTIARACKTRSENAKTFGMQIDSLCDLVCFGVYPVIIGYGLGNRSIFSVCCGMFFVLAAIIRLAYFDVQEINRKINNEDKRTNYTGLPVTSVALIIPAVMLLDLTHFFSIVKYYDIMLVIIGLLFISPFKIKKLYLQGLLCLASVGILVFCLVVKYGQMIQIIS